MTNTDTSAEALERLRKLVAMHGAGADDVAFCALLVERDRLKAERDEARKERAHQQGRADRNAAEHEAAQARAEQAEAERDAANITCDTAIKDLTRVTNLHIAAQDKCDELRAMFDKSWQADMRAIMAWQAANPGNDLVWPDRFKLISWLLAEREAALRERDQEMSDREHWQNQYGRFYGRCIQAEDERDAARAALPDYPPHDPVCSVTDVLREAIAKAKDL